MNKPPTGNSKTHTDIGTVPLSHSLKQKIKDGLVAVSLANLCFIKVSFDLLSDKDRYYNRLPATTETLLALAANLLGFALGFWLVMQMLRRFPWRALHLPVHLAFLFLLLLPVDFIRIKLNITDYGVFQFLKQPDALFCEVVFLVLIVWQHRLAATIAAGFAAILSPLALFTLVKILLVCLGVYPLRNCPPDPTLPPMSPVRADQPRVLWIIFDEMDYRVTFEKPAPGFQFPEFDRLRRESVSATAAVAPADATVMSMPALIMGRRLSAVNANNTCDLSITFADSGKTTNWAGQPSVFSEARGLGFNTALVGWFNPYSRELGTALNYCEWYPYPAYEPARGRTFAGSLWQQINSLTETVHLRELFLKINVQGMKVSLPLVTNAAYGLILLHLPAPHRPGIYLPEQDKFTALAMAHISKVTAYFDNLTLADRELGKLRRAMEASGEWDKTWVILSADHSWRESKLYDGQRDYRVPFIVKPPGATGSADYARPFNTILTHDLILAILHGEITNQQDTAFWLDQHAESSAPIIGAGKE